MLSEWYFCCCMRSSPDKTLGFLAILDTLQNPESDSKLLYLAFDELTRVDAWMQIRAIPRVLALTRQAGLTAGIQPIIRSFFDGLVESLEENERPAISKLLDTLLSGGSGDLLADITDAAAAVEPIHHSAESVDGENSTPYLDLKEYLPESLLLAMMRESFVRDRSLANKLFNQSEQPNVIVELLLTNALAYRYSRLPFLFAVQIGMMIERPREDLLAAIWRYPDAAVAYEPDLLRACAEMWFLPPDLDAGANRRAEVARAMVNESATFSTWRRINDAYNTSSEVDASDGATIHAPIHRIGFEVAGGLRRALPLTYWQSVLWELAAETDPCTAMKELSAFWLQPSAIHRNAVITVRGPMPLDREKRYAWQDIFAALLRLHGLSRQTLAFEFKKTLYVEHWSQPFFCSPWLSRSSLPGEHYQEIGSAATLVRLLTATEIAVHLLRHPDGGASYRRDFASLVIHAADVLTTFRNWFKSYKRAPKDFEYPNLPLPLTSLALFGERQIRMAGCGHLQSVPPDVFLEVMHPPESSENEEHNPEDHRRNLPREKAEFTHFIVPQVLMTWIADAYPGAVNRNGPGRWLDKAAEVYNVFRSAKHGIRNEREAALIMRFLVPGYQLDIAGDMDWRNTQHPSHRLLLLNPALPAEEWEWNDEDLPFDVILARSLERLASLERSPDLNPEVAEQWQHDWIDCLNQVTKQEELDRFTRLRLMELLDDKMLANSPEGQELIALVLLEFGSPYDLARLFDIVFALTDPDRRARANTTRQSVRNALLQAICRDSELRAHYSETRANVQDPRHTRQDLQRAELVEEMVSQIALYGISEGAFTPLRRYLADHRVEVAKARMSNNHRRLQAHVEMTQSARGTGSAEDKRVVAPAGSGVRLWNLRSVVMDRNRQAASLFSEDYDLENALRGVSDARVRNMFEESAREVTDFQNGHSESINYLLGVVVDVVEGRQRNEYRRTFNCGLGFYLSHTFDPRHSHDRDDISVLEQIGMYYALPVCWNPDRSRWRIADAYPVIPLDPRPVRGDIARMHILEYENTSRPGLCAISYRMGSQNIAFEEKSFNVRLWDADISRCFRSPTTGTKRSVYVRKDIDDRWIPLDCNLQDFLLMAISQNDSLHGTFAVLTLVTANVSGPFGERGWRFSDAPGRNFVLYEHQLNPDDANTLSQAVDELEDAAGLLVTLQPRMVSNRLQISLLRELPDDSALEASYPALELPFDRRNINWRGIFTRSENRIAEYAGGNWFVRVDPVVPGYPSAVRVTWGGESIPSARNARVEFTVTRWDETNCRTATVDGEGLRTNRIIPHNRDYSAFIQRWLNLQKGDPVTLRKVISSISADGYVRCLTDELAVIDVEAETISMESSSKMGLKIDTPRPAEVFWAAWFDVADIPEVVAPEIPSTAITGDQCIGILVNVPDRLEGGKLCQVAWQTSTPVEPTPLTIDNLPEFRGVNPGYKIVGQLLANGSWQFRLYFPLVRARALWKLRPSPADDEDLIYLGSISHGEKVGQIAQTTPGEVVIVPALARSITHLATIRGVNVQINRDRIRSDQCLTNAVGKSIWPEGEDKYRRAVLSWPGHTASGFCLSRSPVNNVSLVEARMWLEKSRSDDSLYTLRRLFRLQPWVTPKLPIEKPSAPVGPFATKSSNEEKWQGELDKYLEAPIDLDALYDQGLVSLRDLRVPDLNNSARWVDRAIVPPEEREYILGNEYSHDAWVRLYECGDNKVMASLRQTRPLSSEQFREHLSAEYDELVPLDAPLFYVGPSTIQAENVREGEVPEVQQRFEWGYGKTLLVPQNQLLYNGQPFDNSQLLLFHGDAITHVTFLAAQAAPTSTGTNDEMEESLPEAKCILSLRDIHLRMSEARSLYLQRIQYKLIHILHLSVAWGTSEPQMSIEYVEGYDDNRIDQIRAFRRFRAELSDESRVRLLSRLQANARDDEPHCEYIVMGRLDEEEFRYSLGKRVIFDHVRLSFMPSATEDMGMPVHPNERVFLQAGGIEELANDVALQLKPLSVMDDLDVGSDFRSLRLLRRRFSVREDVLRSIYRERGKDGLKGAVALILVRQDDDGKVYTSLMEGMPLRRTRTLASAISSQQGILLANVIQTTASELRLELKPGVFVQLSRAHVPDYPLDLEKGAGVRIENLPDGGFHVSRATFGNERYVPDTRLVVALPKNSLNDLKKRDPEEDAFWHSRLFTVGDLPNIEAVPGYFDRYRNVWQWPRARDFITIMETPHPKIARIGRDLQGEFRIAPGPTSPPIGKLNTVERIRVEIVTNHDVQPAHWSDLSFGDEPAVQIMKRAGAEKWAFHDRFTSTWSPEGRVIKPPLDLHSAFTGPLFFEVDAESSDWRLRYSESQLLRFGLPVERLVDSLSLSDGVGKRRRRIYPVASVSDQGGLWIELSPGRVVELPAQLAVWRLHGKERSMASFHWPGFAPGDKVELENVTSELLASPRIAIRNWWAGPRAAFNKRRCFLRASSFIQESGLLCLGDGEYVLQYPASDASCAEQTVILEPNNQILPAAETLPRAGDVVLLGLDSNRNLIISGFPDWHPFPEYGATSDWEIDTLASFVFKDLAGLIEAAGGALPVTVKFVRPNVKEMTFTRRAQCKIPILPNGTISFGHIVGLLPDEQTALIRCGGNLLPVQMNKVIFGLPRDMNRVAVSKLKQINRSQVMIWMRRKENGELCFDLEDIRPLEFLVNSVAAIEVSVETRNGLTYRNGLICRDASSLALYWLAEDCIGWTRLSTKQLERIYNRATLRVCLTDRNNSEKMRFLSAVHVKAANKEFESFAIGSEMSVRVLEVIPPEDEDEQKNRYIVESSTSKVVLECETYEHEMLQPGDLVAVEVVKLNAGTIGKIAGVSRTIVTCLAGKRRYTLDLPTTLMSTLPLPGERHSEVSRFLEWCNHPQLLEGFADPELDLKATANDILCQLLCYAYMSREENPRVWQLQANLAREWLSRNQRKPEIDTAYAIMCILLLNSNGMRNVRDVFPEETDLHKMNSYRSLMDGWRDEATNAARNLGVRALRSIHVDVLIHHWLYHTGNRQRQDNLWRRLQPLVHPASGLLLSDNLLDADVRAIRRFCRSVQLRAQADLMPIADALLAALGELSEEPVIFPDARYSEVINQLISLYRTLPHTRSGNSILHVRLHDAHVMRLSRILDLIIDQAWSVPLLDAFSLTEAHVSTSEAAPEDEGND